MSAELLHFSERCGLTVASHAARGLVETFVALLKFAAGYLRLLGLNLGLNCRFGRCIHFSVQLANKIMRMIEIFSRIGTADQNIDASCGLRYRVNSRREMILSYS
jgi:hypothetical protein